MKSVGVTVWVVCQNRVCVCVCTKGGANQNVSHKALTRIRSVCFSLQDYLECISNQSRLALSSEDKGSLFGNIQDIYHFNRYNTLTELETWDLGLCQTDLMQRSFHTRWIKEMVKIHIFTTCERSHHRTITALVEWGFKVLCFDNYILEVDVNVIYKFEYRT